MTFKLHQMTWHPLSTHPLPEPRDGQVLLFRYRAGVRAAAYHPGTTNVGGYLMPCWKSAGAPWSDYGVESDAQWFLVPAPGEQSEADGLLERIAELEEEVRTLDGALKEWCCT